MNRAKNGKDFFKWVEEYDHLCLKSEDDVETKFVIPMFRHLNYPERCRRGKFPIKSYSPKKSGRKPEVDQAYFSSGQHDYQNEDTCLVLVEAKRPGEIKENTQLQPLFYGHFLKPLIVLITDGYRLRVLKFHHHGSAETFFDDTVWALKNKDLAAMDFYDCLNFEAIKELKVKLTNNIFHKQYIELEKVLQGYPEIQTILSQGDFEPSVSKKCSSSSSFLGRKSRIKVVKPKIAIDAELPLAFEYCEWKIEFSHVIRRGLSLKLSHHEIFADFMLGLTDPPNWNTRKFIREIDKNSFETRLGQATTILSGEEATDLCACIDLICHEYKRIVIQSENLLKANYFLVCYDGKEDFFRKDIQFYLFSIKAELWQAILQFKNEFDYENGDSDWHIFDKKFDFLWIHGSQNKFVEHAFIFPSNSQEGYVDLLYCVPVRFLRKFDNWTEHVGPKGVWTAPYAKNWILRKLIPQVSKYMDIKTIDFRRDASSNFGFVSNWFVRKSDRDKADRNMDYNAYYVDLESSQKEFVFLQNAKENKIALEEIERPDQLHTYIDEIQGWLHFRPVGIGIDVLSPFLLSFSILIRNVDHSSLDVDHIYENIYGIGRSYKEKKGYAFDCKGEVDFEQIVRYFEILTGKAKDYGFFSHKDADYIFRACCSIAHGNFLEFEQFELNAAIKNIKPLWELCCFEKRYVFSHWTWNGIFYEN